MNVHHQTEPMPFTRDAIAMIRAGYKASDLGWEQSFYERICREQGVTPVPAPKTIAAAIVEAVEAPPAVFENKRAPKLPPEKILTPLQSLLLEDWHYGERRFFVFEYPGRIGPVQVRRKGAKHAVKLFLMLAHAPGERVSSRQYAEATETAVGAATVKVSNASRALRQSLLKTPFDIDVAYKHGGGYMLIYSKSKDPAQVKVISVGGVMLDGEPSP